MVWISGVDHHINGINILGIEVSSKEDKSIWKTSFDTRFSVNLKPGEIYQKVPRKSCIEGVLPPTATSSVGENVNNRWIRFYQKVIQLTDLMEERSSLSRHTPAIPLRLVNVVSFPIIMSSRSVSVAFPRRSPAHPNPDALSILAAPQT
jgi:hypothetical protein